MSFPELLDELRKIIAENTADNPTVPGLKWTHLSIAEIVRELCQRGFKVPWDVVSRLLGELGYKTRQQVKSKTKAPSRDRDAQFETLQKTTKTRVNRYSASIANAKNRRAKFTERTRSSPIKRPKY